MTPGGNHFAEEPQWEFQHGWVKNPPLRTQQDLLAKRKKDMLPDASFDVDGDGVVSSTDYFLSSQFDINKDGFIDDDERKELRKQMVQSLVKTYQSAPKVDNPATRALLRKFTKDLDNTVSKSSFVHDFNELYSRTASTQVADSTQMFGCLCPRELARHQQKVGHVDKYSGGQVTARTDRNYQDLKVGTDHTRWSGFDTRSEMIKSRRKARTAEMEQRNAAYCSTFPAPGNCNPTVDVLGPPGVRKHNHHRTGFHAPLL